MSAAEYLPPDEMTLDAAGQALARHLEVRDGLVRETERTYYDTFDGRLHDAGLSLSFEGGDLMLTERETGRMRARLAMSQPAKPLFASELGSGPLRDALRPIIDVRALLALVHVRTRERVLDLLDDERKTVVRMALEEPVLVKSTPSPTALRPRVRVAAVRGYDEALDQVRGALEDELGFKLVNQPLVDEAVRAAGAAPGGISSKLDVPLDYEQRSDSAAAAVLAPLLEVIEANLEGTIADVDSEFLHDLRVSVRRSRAVQRELAGVFPPPQLASFRGEFRWLQQISGDSRDLDVYVLEFDDYRAMVPEEMRPDLDPLLEVLSSRRLAAHAVMARELRSTRATSLRSDWSSFLGGLEGLAKDDRPDAARPIGELAGERVRKVYRRMVRMGDAIGESSPADDYHELRKKGKELRYLLELFAVSLYPGEVVKPMIKALKALQDVLGRHQDREVQVAMLHSQREEVAAMREGPAALMAMGALVRQLGEDQLAARGAFAERFAEFASKSQRKLVKDTFA
jgi:CHAD domain-containing protein